MIVRDLITDGIIPLKTSDTGRTALSWMEDFRLLHLPIVNDSQFLGLISEYDIYSFNHFDEAIGGYNLSLQSPYVYEHQHIYEALKLVKLHRLSLIPVIDEKEIYLGSITLQSLLEHFADTLSVDEPGGIIVLGINIRDYVLSEIARIVETNDAKILSLIVKSDKDTTRIEVTLKLNKRDIAGILQTFIRFNYDVLASFGESDDFDDLKERYESLMTYLKV
jgi:acetoin utilization protein AcuB